MKKIIVGVMGLPIRKKGKDWEFLLTKRHAPHKETFHNKWQLSGGGLEFGETPEQCLIREFKEELDVIPRILYPYPIVLTNTWMGGDEDTSNDVHIVLMAYICNIGNQKITILDPDNETSDWGWFSEEDVKKLEKLPKTIEFISKAKKIIKDFMNVDCELDKQY